MFEEKMEKGLFTFYWEQSHKQLQSSVRNHLYSQVRDDSINQQKEKNIEENCKRIKHHKTQKQQPSRGNKHYCSYFSNNDNKNTLIPHHITLSPQIKLTNIGKTKVKSIKLKRSKDISNTQSDREKVRKSLQTLLFSQQPNESHKKNIQIDQRAIVNRNSYLSTVRLMKKRKITAKQQINRNEQNELNTKLPLINTPQTINYYPILFGKHSQKKLKSLKQNFCFSQINVHKQQQEGNSIINIGVSSNDQYKNRWKRKKQEFLTLINKNISKQGLASH